MFRVKISGNLLKYEIAWKMVLCFKISSLAGGSINLTFRVLWSWEGKKGMKYFSNKLKFSYIALRKNLIKKYSYISSNLKTLKDIYKLFTLFTGILLKSNLIFRMVLRILFMAVLILFTCAGYAFPCIMMDCDKIEYANEL